MTLATRCPSCGTTFRVVSDQLKLRKGLVKCGRCLTVFNGVEKLHYIADETVKTQVTVPAPEAAATETQPAAHAGPASIAREPVVSEPAPVETPVDTPVDTPADTPVEAGIEARQDEPPPDQPPASPAAEIAADQAAPAVPDPLRPDLPRFAPAPSGPPAATTNMSFVEPDASIDFPVEDPVRNTTPRDSRPWPEISTAMLDGRRPGPPPVVVDTAPSPAAAGDDDEAVMDPDVVDIEGFAVHDMDDIVFDDGLSSDAAKQAESLVAGAHPGPDEDPAAPSPAAVRATNLRNIFEGDNAFDDLREVSVDSAGVLPQQIRTEELGPLTLLDVAGDRDVPMFLQEPKRASRGARIATASTCVLALLVLLVQAAFVYRAELVASYPVARPALEALCSAIGSDCTVGLPRRISQLRVVSAELQAAPQSGDRRYLLRFGLGNDSSRVQAWPNLELMLTDIRNQQVVRRVITPAEYLGAGRSPADARARLAAGLRAKGDESLSIPVRVDLPDPVYGYALGIFHP
ncbi:DUF3426 domain-containing protein [soil metagenome]